jgi:hypothetical protein
MQAAAKHDVAPVKRRVYYKNNKKMEISGITLDMTVAGLYNCAQRQGDN